MAWGDSRAHKQPPPRATASTLYEKAAGEARGAKPASHPAPAPHRPQPSQAPALPTPGFVPSHLQTLLELEDD